MTAEEILETVRQAGGELWAVGDKLRYRLPAGAPDVIPAMRELKPQLLHLLRPADDPAAWESAFASWMKSACVLRPRCFGGVGCLLLSFAEFCAAGSEVAPCTRATFELLLINADFLLADGLVCGLIFKADLEAAFAVPDAPKVQAPKPRRKGWSA